MIKISLAEKKLFESIDTHSVGYILKHDYIDILSKKGIHADDPRIEGVIKKLDEIGDNEKINIDMFAKINHSSALAEKVLVGNLIIPDFEKFCSEIKEIYTKTISNTQGKLPDYIPQLARVNPDNYAISICTVDGQRFSIGDSEEYFCTQSTCKPINYCLAQQEIGEDNVHKHIGKEPSGHGFNVLELNPQNLPHNPLNNAGAIMACSLIQAKLNLADRFDYIMEKWNLLSGGIFTPRFNNAVFLSEKNTADRNFALAHFMREKKAFPPDIDLYEVLDFYFQCCSIEMTAPAMAVVASTLANAGVCPLTEERIFDQNVVKNCLSLMSSCGMYDFSGEFSFMIGLPAKSGVSGVIILVIPNVMGICIWSPLLDPLGNSIRGVEFCKELLNRFNFHKYDSLVNATNKIDPRNANRNNKLSGVVRLLWAASRGDLDEIRHLVASGIDLDEADYDGRTALHLAASENKIDVIRFLVAKKVNINPIDRWGGTPLSDAKRHNYTDIVAILEQHLTNKS